MCTCVVEYRPLLVSGGTADLLFQPEGDGMECGFIGWFDFFLSRPLVLINEVDKQLFRENNNLLTVSHSSARLTVQRDGQMAQLPTLSTCTERCRYGPVSVAELHFLIPGSKIKVLISFEPISICARAPQRARNYLIQKEQKSFQSVSLLRLPLSAFTFSSSHHRPGRIPRAATIESTC